MRIYKVWIVVHAAVEVLMHANSHIDFCGVIDTKGQLRSELPTHNRRAWAGCAE